MHIWILFFVDNLFVCIIDIFVLERGYVEINNFLNWEFDLDIIAKTFPMNKCILLFQFNPSSSFNIYVLALYADHCKAMLLPLKILMF